MTSLISRLLCLGLALYFLGHAAYGAMNWEEYLSARPHFIRYLLAPLGLAAGFALAAFLLRRQARLLVGIHASALLVALYMVEAYLTASFYFSRPAATGESRTATDVDLGFTPARLNWFLETRTLADAMLGHVPFTTIELCAVDYGPVRITTDRHGLNNPDAVFDQPVRVAVVGDSFIHGYCVPPGQDIVSRVRARVPGTVNMAVTGTGPLFQLALVGRHVAAVQPDHVVACFYEGNDLRDLPGELRSPWLATGLDPGTDFGPSPAKAETLARVEALNRRHRAGEALDPRLLGALRQELGWRDLVSNPTMLRNFAALGLTSGMLGIGYGRAPTHLEEYTAIMRRTRAIVDGWGGRLHLCYLPSRQRFGLVSSHYAFDVIRDRILGVAAELGLDVVDVTGQLAEHPAPRSLYSSDGHFSIEGSALAAEVLADHLAALPPTD